MALLYFTKVSACSTIAEVFPKASHDCLTRMLNGDWSGQTLLDWALRILFLIVGGYSIVDDTVVEKPHAKRLNEAGWVWSSKRNKASMESRWCCWCGPMVNCAFPSAFGCGRRAAPPNLSWPEKLLSYARNRLKC